MEIRDQMQVLEAIKEKERIKVRTTGAVYLFHTQGDLGRIECFQTLNKERKLGMCQVDMSFEKLEVEVMDKDKCILHAIPREMSCSYIRIEVHRDSMLEIYATQSLHIEYRTDFSAEYEACEKDCQVAADAYGGFGLYPVRNLTNAKNFENGETKVYDYEFDAYGLFMLSVFPPRPYPVEQSYDERLFLRFSVQHGNKNAAYPFVKCRECLQRRSPLLRQPNKRRAFLNKPLHYSKILTDEKSFTHSHSSHHGNACPQPIRAVHRAHYGSGRSRTLQLRDRYPRSHSRI